MSTHQLNIHSSQEALALAVRDWLLNSGQLVKCDVVRIGNIIQLVRPLQKKSGDAMKEIEDEFKGIAEDFNPLYDKAGYLNLKELKYEIQLTKCFGNLWKIMHEEELIPPGLLSGRKEKWED